MVKFENSASFKLDKLSKTKIRKSYQGNGRQKLYDVCGTHILFKKYMKIPSHQQNPACYELVQALDKAHQQHLGKILIAMIQLLICRNYLSYPKLAHHKEMVHTFQE